MPLGVNVYNPNTQTTSTPVSTENTVTFGGNALGTGASTSQSSAASGFSNILLCGCIALVIIFILKKLGN